MIEEEDNTPCSLCPKALGVRIGYSDDDGYYKSSLYYSCAHKKWHKPLPPILDDKIDIPGHRG